MAGPPRLLHTGAGNRSNLRTVARTSLNNRRPILQPTTMTRLCSRVHIRHSLRRSTAPVLLCRRTRRTWSGGPSAGQGASKHCWHYIMVLASKIRNRHCLNSMRQPSKRLSTHLILRRSRKRFLPRQLSQLSLRPQRQNPKKSMKSCEKFRNSWKR